MAAKARACAAGKAVRQGGATHGGRVKRGLGRFRVTWRWGWSLPASHAAEGATSSRWGLETEAFQGIAETALKAAWRAAVVARTRRARSNAEGASVV